jgi:LuxR family maltose regulon positive regulatory protein
VAFAYLHSHDKEPAATFDHCKTAMKNLSDEDPLWFSWAWFSYGIAYFAIGELIESRKAFHKALNYGKKTGNIYLISSIVSRLAENEQQLGYYTSAYKTCTELIDLLKEKGYLHLSRADWTFAPLYLIMGITKFTWADMDEAYESIKTAYDLSKKSNDIYLKVFILMFYSFLLWLRSDAESLEKRKELEEIIEHNQIPPFLMSMVVGWKVFFHLQTGQLEKAKLVIAQQGLSLDEEKTHANETEYMAFIRVLLTECKLDEAEKLLSELYPLAESGKRVERLIELNLLYASLYQLKEEKDKAIGSMIDAMRLAADENILTYFISSRNLTGDLLYEVIKLQATKNTGIPKEFIQNLQLALQRLDRYKKARDQSDLSEREKDTLKLMAAGLRNQEIADKLFISLNTVKTHVRNILLKLEAENRSQAVARAKEASIL